MIDQLKIIPFVCRSHLLFFCIMILCLCSCEKEKKTVQVPPRPVQIAEASQETLEVYVQAFGNVYATNSVPIVAQVTGQIVEAHILEGAKVKAGDLLFTIDPRPYEAALAEAKATLLKDQAALDFAQDRLDRNKDLVKKDYVAQLTFNQYQADVNGLLAQVEVDKAAIETAQLNLSWTQITAPTNGRIGFFSQYPGSIVAANDIQSPIATLLDVDPIEVRFAVTQKQFLKMKAEDKNRSLPMNFTLKSLPDVSYAGKVIFVDNEMSLQTGTIMLMALLPNEKMALWPGEYGVAKVKIAEIPDAIVIPEGAVLAGQKGSYLYTVTPDMKADLRWVTVGEKQGGKIQIVSGVEKGEKIVITGQLNLRSGTQVMITDADGNPLDSTGKPLKLDANTETDVRRSAKAMETKPT